MDSPSNGQRLSFGLFEADLSARELRKRGHRIHLQDQPFQLLSLLLQRPLEVVTRDEVRKKLWPDGTYIDFDEGLDTALKKLRHALGDSAQNPTFIETVPRRGYRFIAPVTYSAQSGNSEPAPVAGSPQAAPSLRPTDPQDGVSVQLVPTAVPLRYALAVSFVVVVVVAATGIFIYKRLPARSSASQKLRQLTLNSVENPVSSAAISPDGKYLAYADVNGMHLQLVDTGEARTVPQPESLENDVQWEIRSDAWFPDSVAFVVNAHPVGESEVAWSSQTSSIWMVSVLGGAPRKLRDHAMAWSVFPDGPSISFAANTGKRGEREAWLMSRTGQQARKLFDSDANSSIAGLQWAQLGQRAIYFRPDDLGNTFVSRELNGGPITTLLPSSQLKNLNDASWLPDGRFVYSLREAQAIGDTCNFWTVRLDPRTGQTIEKTKQLTNLAGFCLDHPSISNDGKRLAFRQSSTQGTGYVADLKADGTRILKPKQFTSREGESVVADWTSDGKTAILALNRGDHYALYKQLSNSDTPEPIVTSAANALLESAQVTPDDKWVVLQVYPLPGSPSAQTPLMRVPITGGSPELIFSLPTGSGFSCARPPHNLCALAEPTVDRMQMIVTAFDPLNGKRGLELARFGRDPHMREDATPAFAISPDGARLAASRGQEGLIQILSLNGQQAQVIQVPGLHDIRLLGWTWDGRGLFVINGTNDGTELRHVDLQGHTQVLWKCSGGQQCDFTPSPDGRHLAILDRQLSANIWMMENF
jgi:DNA-binding winged helix-turn-helix (wHTH) protein/Tol biopolymer transport system component